MVRILTIYKICTLNFFKHLYLHNHGCLLTKKQIIKFLRVVRMFNHKVVFCCLNIISFMLLGCELQTPPECAKGQEKCEDNELGTGIYSLCGTNGKWGAPMACLSECEGRS